MCALIRVGMRGKPTQTRKGSKYHRLILGRSKVQSPCSGEDASTSDIRHVKRKNAVGHPPYLVQKVTGRSQDGNHAGYVQETGYYGSGRNSPHGGDSACTRRQESHQDGKHAAAYGTNHFGGNSPHREDLARTPLHCIPASGDGYVAGSRARASRLA